MGINARGAGDHLLQPGTRADMRQAGDHSDLGRVQPLIGHGHGDQDGRLRPQAKGGQHLRGVTLLRYGQAGVEQAARRREAGAQVVEVAARLRLVGRHHQELAQAAWGGVGVGA
jgi:hypothetical protein